MRDRCCTREGTLHSHKPLLWNGLKTEPLRPLSRTGVYFRPVCQRRRALVSVHPTDVVAALPHAGLARNPLSSTGRSLGLTLSDIGLSLRNQVSVPGHAPSIGPRPSEA